MKFSPILMLLALCLLSACATEQHKEHYTKLRATNHRNELIAEWVAKGPVLPVLNGYRITAVERLSGPPLSMLSTYPHGWKTTVAGPNIVRWRCGKPLWLYELEEGSATEVDVRRDYK